MKRIIICCDGTWNELDYRNRPVTNVVKMAQSILPKSSDGNGNTIENIVYYDEGVGTLDGEGFKGGAFGAGLEQNIVDAYYFLTFNYQPGDKIYIFGFSRGAYTARSLAGLIRACGIVRREHAHRAADAVDRYKDRPEADDPDRHTYDEATKAFRLKYGYKNWWVGDEDDDTLKAANPEKKHQIEYLGVWDTVGTNGLIGAANIYFGRKESHGFHDHKLSAIVRSARHAVATDETRQMFTPCPWDETSLAWLNENHGAGLYQQAWFPGDHGSVGGGGDLTGLSDQALSWVAAGAVDGGHPIYDTQFRPVRFPVAIIKEGARKTTTKIIKYQPNNEDPLKNMSTESKLEKERQKNLWQRGLSRVVSAFIDKDGAHRLNDLDKLPVFADAFWRYEGEQGYLKRIRGELKPSLRKSFDAQRAQRR